MRFDPVSGGTIYHRRGPGFFKQQMKSSCHEQKRFSGEIEAEMQKLEWCDLLILQFPLWWFGCRVLRDG